MEKNEDIYETLRNQKNNFFNSLKIIKSMFFFWLSSALAVDAKTLLVGKWSAYPGSAHSYAPQLKYTFAFYDDPFDERRYATAWTSNKMPTNDNVDKAAFAGDVKIFFQSNDRGLYVAGDDRHWYPFVFQSQGNGKVCNITFKNGRKFGVYLINDKLIEVTAVLPNGTIEHQYLCFAGGADVNTTAAGHYAQQLHQPPEVAQVEFDDDDDDHKEKKNVQQGQIPVQQQVIPQAQSISPAALILVLGTFCVLQVFLCSCFFCVRSLSS